MLNQTYAVVVDAEGRPMHFRAMLFNLQWSIASHIDDVTFLDSVKIAEDLVKRTTTLPLKVREVKIEVV